MKIVVKSRYRVLTEKGRSVVKRREDRREFRRTNAIIKQRKKFGREFDGLVIAAAKESGVHCRINADDIKEARYTFTNIATGEVLSVGTYDWQQALERAKKRL